MAATLIVSLAIGAASSFIFGHRQGRSDNARDLAEAKNRAENSAQRQEALEKELGFAKVELNGDKERLAAIIRERDAQLASAKEATAHARAQTKVAEERFRLLAAKGQREVDERRLAESDKKKIPAVLITEERTRKSEVDHEYVSRKLQSTDRSILKGMSMLFGFNSLCDEDSVTKESISRVVGDDRDLLFTSAQMLVDVGNYIPPKTKKGLTLKESWDICMEALGVKK